MLDFLIGTFQPLIGVITGGGLIKTLLTLLTMAGWMDKSSDLYQVMFNIADATFYFLPVMIAYTSATKLKQQDVRSDHCRPCPCCPSFPA